MRGLLWFSGSDGKEERVGEREKLKLSNEESRRRYKKSVEENKIKIQLLS